MDTAKVDNGAIVGLQHGVARSPHWPTVEKAFKAKFPDCIACSEEDAGKYPIQVHHALVPFHLAVLAGRPDLELDFRNLRSLCETEKGRPAKDHHISLGHLMNFRSWNKNLDEDAKVYRSQAEKMIESSPDFVKKVASRPDPEQEKSPEALKELRGWLDGILPPDPVVLAMYFPQGLPVISFSS